MRNSLRSWISILSCWTVPNRSPSARRLVEVLAQLVVVDEVPDRPLAGVDLLRDLLDVRERLVELVEARADGADALPQLFLVLRPDHVPDRAEDVARLGGGVAGVAQDRHHVAFAALADAVQVAREPLHVVEDRVDLGGAAVDGLVEPRGDPAQVRDDGAEVVLALRGPEHLAEIGGDFRDVARDLVQRAEDLVHAGLPDDVPDLVPVVERGQVGRAGRQVEEEVAEDAFRALGDAGVLVQDELLPDLQPHLRPRRLLIELDPIHLPDRDAGDLHPGSVAEPAGVVEHGVDAVGLVASDVRADEVEPERERDRRRRDDEADPQRRPEGMHAADPMSVRTR